MNKLLVTLSFLISIICLTSQSWALPKCIGLWSTSNWNNCFGTYVWKSGKHKGDKYVGEHKDGLAYGQGTYFFVNGDKYIGEWKENKEHGQGTYTWKKSENKYVGEWKNGKINGQGTKTFADGTIEEGIWKDGKFMYAKKTTSTSNSKLEGYKNFCSDIGFTPGTEKFGDCVVEAMKKG